MAGSADKEKDNGIKVYARIRKLMAWEDKTMTLKWTLKSITNQGRKDDRTISTYKFTQVYSPTVENPMVFDNLVKPLIKRVCNGYNAVLMAYGQTGAGKTHSLLGKPKRNILGLLPMALKFFIEDPNVTSITVKSMEAFGQNQNKIRIYDLLDPANDCETWEDKSGKTVFNFQSVKSRKIETFEEAKDAVHFAQNNSHYAPTGKNPDSSRGHTVFVVDVTTSVEDESMPAGLGMSTRSASLLFCDLAGSEGESALGPEFRQEYGAQSYKARRMEAGVINQGLSDLQMIFTQLKNGKLKDYQGAGLRKILKQYIKDNSTYISVLFCVSPAPNNATSTESTLKFAQQACQIKVVPKQVRVRTDWKELSHKLRDMNVQQHHDIEKLKEHGEKILNELKDLQRLRDAFEVIYGQNIPGLHRAMQTEDVLHWFDESLVELMQADEELREKKQLKKGETLLDSEDFSKDFSALENKDDEELSRDSNYKWRERRGESVASAMSVDFEKISVEHRSIYEKTHLTEAKSKVLLDQVFQADQDEDNDSSDDFTGNVASGDNVCWEYDETAFKQYVMKEKDKYLQNKRKERRGKNFSTEDIDLDELKQQEEVTNLRAQVHSLRTQLHATSTRETKSTAVDSQSIAGSVDYIPKPSSQEDDLNSFLQSCGEEYVKYFQDLALHDFFVDRLASTYPSELEMIVPDEDHRAIILQRAQNNKTPQAVAMEYVRYYNAHDLTKLCNLYASHCRNTQFALSTPIIGKKAITAAYESMFELYPDLGCKVTAMHTTSYNSVVLEWEGWWQESNSNSRLHGCTVFTVEHGVIIEQREYWDKLKWKRHHDLWQNMIIPYCIDYESRPTWTFVLGFGAISLGAGYLLRHRRSFVHR